MDLDLSLGTSPAEPLKKAFSGGGAAASGGTPAIGLKLGFCRVENIKEREAEQRRGSVHHLQAFSQEIDNTILEAPARELDAGGGGGGGAGELGFSDEEENAGAKKKLRLTREQSVFLEENFKEHSTLKPKQKAALAKQLNLRPRQVEVWFQNRRARTKLKQTEVDCEYLKRCCEALTEENRRLQKELSELRALKSAHPFYAELPATTLSICAACDRASKPVTAGTDSRQSGTFTALFAKVHFHALTNPAVTPSHQSSAAS